LTKEIINLCTEKNIGRIFYGDIKVKKLTKSKVASKGMNKSTQNRGSLGRTKQFLQYKAGFNGIEFDLINEAWTSKTNCFTGEIWSDMTLGIREVELVEGLVIDRDINAAINIARRTLGEWLPHLLWLNNITITEKYVVI
jgi:IS605 OrfB family transposase